MTTIDCAHYGLTLGERRVSSIAVSPIFFAEYLRIMGDAASSARTPDDVNRMSFRARVKHQTTLILDNGEKAKFDDKTYSGMHPRLGIAIKQAINAVPADGDAAMLHKGDGVSAAVHIKLGTPIKATSGKDAKDIAELEFRAKTLGEMEDVIVADGRAEQVLALMKMAKPVGATLLALPSWAVDQISLADGLFILNEVLPCFLDEQAEASAAAPDAKAS